MYYLFSCGNIKELREGCIKDGLKEFSHYECYRFFVENGVHCRRPKYNETDQDE